MLMLENLFDFVKFCLLPNAIQYTGRFISKANDSFSIRYNKCLDKIFTQNFNFSMAISRRTKM